MPRHIAPLAAPASPPTVIIVDLPAPADGSLVAWAVLQVCILAIVGWRTPFFAAYPAVAGRISVSTTYFAELLLITLLSPRVCRDVRSGLIAVSLATPTLIAAALLDAASAWQSVGPLLTLAIWTTGLTLLQKILRSPRSSQVSLYSQDAVRSGCHTLCVIAACLSVLARYLHDDFSAAHLPPTVRQILEHTAVDPLAAPRVSTLLHWTHVGLIFPAFVAVVAAITRALIRRRHLIHRPSRSA